MNFLVVYSIVSMLCSIKTIRHKTMQKPDIDSKCWAAFLKMGARLENSPSSIGISPPIPI